MGGGGGNGGGRVIRVVGAVAVQDNQVKIQGEAERDLTDEASQGGGARARGEREQLASFLCESHMNAYCSVMPLSKPSVPPK